MNPSEIRKKIQISKVELKRLKTKRKHLANNIKKTKIVYKNIERTPIEEIELSSIALFLKFLRETLKDLDQLYKTQKDYHTRLHLQMDYYGEKVWIS